MRPTLRYITRVALPLVALCLTLGSTYASATEREKKTKQQTLLIGTYTAKDSEGIYRSHFNPKSGSLSQPELLVKVDNPSFLAMSEDKAHLYAVSEGGNNESSALNAFDYNPATHSATLINRQPTHGASPCYVALHRDNAFTANYTGGSYSKMKIAADGSLGKSSAHPIIKEGRRSHIHGIFPTPDGENIYITDLGCDLLLKCDAEGNILSETALSRGSGPRHLAFSKSGNRAYLLNELSGTVCVFDISGREPQLLQEIASDSVGGGGSADIHLSPDGRYLYASNRLKEDGISVFSIDKSGRLKKIGYTKTGIHPRNFTLSPDGRFLLVAERDSNCIEVFARNKRTGLLKPTPHKLHLSMPVFVMWE